MTLQTNQNRLVKFDPTCLVAFLFTLLSIYYFFIGGVETGIIFIVVALVDKFLELVKDLDLPFLFENVPGSYNNITKRYGLRGKVSNSVNFGVPQKRDRVFYSDLFFDPLVTHHGGKGAIEILFGGIIYPAVTVADILEQHTEEELNELRPSEAVLRRLDKTLKAQVEKKRLAGFAYGCPVNLTKPMQTVLAKDSRYYVVYTGFPNRKGLNIKELDKPNFTLQSQTDHFLTNKDGWRHFSLVELKRIMGFSDDYIITGSKNQQGRQLGNAVCPPVAKAIAESLKSHFAKKLILQEVKN